MADAAGAVWGGRAESDSLNRLVPAAAAEWRQVTILRAYRQYRQVLGGGFTKRYQNDAFVRNAGVAAQLVRAVRAAARPAREPASEDVAAGSRRDRRRPGRIASLDDDRILRAFLGHDHGHRAHERLQGRRALPYLSFKLRCAEVPGMPKPVPLLGDLRLRPAMEGVHLRGGFVARGGIRWSDRLEDYRTEILGLMKAQMVKNAVIVPVGAKGGFVLKRPPADRDELMRGGAPAVHRR